MPAIDNTTAATAAPFRVTYLADPRNIESFLGDTRRPRPSPSPMAGRVDVGPGTSPVARGCVRCRSNSPGPLEARAIRAETVGEPWAIVKIFLLQKSIICNSI